MMFCRSPGRVNLIGEHIDYMGYGVLPFALEKDTLMLFQKTKNNNQLKITHVDSMTYPPFSLS